MEKLFNSKNQKRFFVISKEFFMERRIFKYQDTEVLKDYPIKNIRIVRVPHMSSFEDNSNEIRNIRTNVGLSGEEYYDC